MKIAVLLSGGVDSSTALWRLKESGHTDITAYYLKIWLEDDAASMGSCPWEEDLAFAQAVCDSAGVELRVVSLQLEYYDRVVSYALDELKAGRTPSPDIFCNERIKFGAFFDHLSEHYDKVASGHYARVEQDGVTGRWRLLRAPDPVKDQTYFLSHLRQDQLGKILFPIGELHKTEVRSLAARYDLATQSRPDSQGICFLGKIRYPDFVKFYLGEKEGPIVHAETGQVLGRHRGFWFHTVGQRAGLGLGNGPWYVSAKDCAANIVYVEHATAGTARMRTGFEVEDFSWLSGHAPSDMDLNEWNRVGLTVKLRHGPQLIPARVNTVSRGNGTYSMTLTEGDAGIAAGQFGVLYLGQECLGSGRIKEPDPHVLRELQARYQARQEQESAARFEAETRKKEKKAARYRVYKDSVSQKTAGTSIKAEKTVGSDGGGL